MKWLLCSSTFAATSPLQATRTLIPSPPRRLLISKLWTSLSPLAPQRNGPSSPPRHFPTASLYPRSASNWPKNSNTSRASCASPLTPTHAWHGSTSTTPSAAVRPLPLLASSSLSEGLTAASSGLSPIPVLPSALGAKGGAIITLSAAPLACAVPYVGGPINKPTTTRRSNPKGPLTGDASTVLPLRSLPRITPPRTTSVRSGKIVSIAHGSLASLSAVRLSWEKRRCYSSHRPLGPNVGLFSLTRRL
jgi:hypothetical protein